MEDRKTREITFDEGLGLTCDASGAESPAAEAAVSEAAEAAVSAENKQPDGPSELEALREENRRLKAEREREEKFREEAAALCALVPECDASALPEEVLAEYEKGVPLDAAYALWDRKRVLRELAERENDRLNAEASTGEMTGDGQGDGSFTLDEIRRMPRSEVRRCLDRIYHSLESGRR